MFFDWTHLLAALIGGYVSAVVSRILHNRERRRAELAAARKSEDRR